MRTGLRLSLAAAVLLAAGGFTIVPHVDPPGRPVWHVDHVPSAYHLNLLAQLVPELDPGDGAVLLADPHPVLAAAATVAALAWLGVLVTYGARATHGIALASALAAPRWAVLTPHGPPRELLPS